MRGCRAGVVLVEGDLVRPLADDGWGQIGTAMVWTRPLGVGVMLSGDLSETERCYLDVSPGTPRPLARFGEAPPGSCAFRISRVEMARAWRGRDLDRRLVRDVLDRVPESAFILGLDPVPKAPGESGRSDAEAQRLIECFWARVGFRPCAEDPRTWTATWDEVDTALHGVEPLAG
jgi:hypothetical protein